MRYKDHLQKRTEIGTESVAQSYEKIGQTGPKSSILRNLGMQNISRCVLRGTGEPHRKEFRLNPNSATLNDA